MGYVESQLLTSEQIKHRARLHRIIYLLPAISSVITLLLIAVAATTPDVWIGALFGVAMTGLLFLRSYVLSVTSEFAVTDKRVIIKVGLVKRRTLETMLSKVEGISVDQGIIGRLLNYGTIVVTGTGGTREPFTDIANPLEFRRRVQSEIVAVSESTTWPMGVRLPAGAGSPVSGGAVREERECPYCAELILVKARVCKHCGRDVFTAARP